MNAGGDASGDADADGYAGPAELHPDGEAAAAVPVRVRLSGRVEPLDGRYHWAGRIAPDERVARLARTGARGTTLRVGAGPAVAVRLGDVDPWGGVRISAVGRPPWLGASAA